MLKKNPYMFILFWIFLVINLVDSITAFFILGGESNPLFLLSKNIYILIAFKIIIIGALWYYCNRNIYPSNFWYYMTIIMMVLGTLLVSFGCYSNIQGMLHPELVEEASKIPSNVKQSMYFGFVTIVYIIPLLFSLGSFLLYDKSLKYAKVDKKYFKKRKWWQL